MNRLQFDFEDKQLAFETPLTVYETSDLEKVTSVMQAVEAKIAAGYYAAGFVSYEAAPTFDSHLAVKSPSGSLPLIWFGIYETPITPSMKNSKTSSDIPFHWQSDTDFTAYQNALQSIKEEIARGNTYQTNYTVRLNSPAESAADYTSFYEKLLQNGKATYSASLCTDSFQILSASPELFFKWEKDRITTRPMKGTIHRGASAEEDRELRDWLGNDAKNRAENTMIVDLLRNDLGKIAVPGSVQVEALCQLEPYPTTWQMTSTITAQTAPQTSLVDVFQALFPCGSITGAPKQSTMSLIEQLETSPRGIYCGAIGYITPAKQAVFSVPIRTVAIHDSIASYGVGGGIVWDSVIEEEYAEMQTKTKVLLNSNPSFHLIESLRLENGGLSRLEAHLDRLENSARFFAFPFDRAKTSEQWRSASQQYPRGTFKFRSCLLPDGKLSLEALPLVEYQEPIRAVLAKNPISTNSIWLKHKTSHRSIYEKHRQENTQETILFNKNGQLTEFITGNIVLQIDDQLYTPMLDAGVLPGVMRQTLLTERKITERTLLLEDLKKAKKIWLINSVRGWVPIYFQP